MSENKYKELESRKIELQKELGEPVFIDIKQEKLYTVNENGYCEYVI